MRLFPSSEKIDHICYGSYRLLKQKHERMKQDDHWVCIDTALAGDALYEIYHIDFRFFFKGPCPELEHAFGLEPYIGIPESEFMQTNEEVIYDILSMTLENFRYRYEQHALKESMPQPRSANITIKLDKIFSYLSKSYGMDERFIEFMGLVLEEFKREYGKALLNKKYVPDVLVTEAIYCVCGR